MKKNKASEPNKSTRQSQYRQVLFNCPTLLVVDSEYKQVRRLISAADIARRLHIPLQIELPTTFVDIFVAVNTK